MARISTGDTTGESRIRQVSVRDEERPPDSGLPEYITDPTPEQQEQAQQAAQAPRPEDSGLPESITKTSKITSVVSEPTDQKDSLLPRTAPSEISRDIGTYQQGSGDTSLDYYASQIGQPFSQGGTVSAVLSNGVIETDVAGGKKWYVQVDGELVESTPAGEPTFVGTGTISQIQYEDYEVAINELKPYLRSDGTYDLKAAIDAGIPNQTLFNAGYAINDILAYRQYIENYEKALEEAKPYLTQTSSIEAQYPEGGAPFELFEDSELAKQKVLSYNIVAMIEDGVSDKTLNTLFTPESIKEAKEYVKKLDQIKKYDDGNGGYDLIGASQDKSLDRNILESLFGANVVAAAEALAPYTDADGNVDLDRALLEGKVTPEQAKLLFKPTVVRDAEDRVNKILENMPREWFTLDDQEYKEWYDKLPSNEQNKIAKQVAAYALLNVVPAQAAIRLEQGWGIIPGIGEIEEWANNAPDAIKIPVQFLAGLAVGGLVEAPIYTATFVGTLAGLSAIGGSQANIKDIGPATTEAAIGVGQGIWNYMASIPAKLATSPAFTSGELVGLFILGTAGTAKLFKNIPSAAKGLLDPSLVTGLAYEFNVGKIPVSKGQIAAAIEKGLITKTDVMRAVGEAQNIFVKSVEAGKPKDISVKIGNSDINIVLRQTPASQKFGGLWHVTDYGASFKTQEAKLSTKGKPEPALFTSVHPAASMALARHGGKEPAYILIYTREGVKSYPSNIQYAQRLSKMRDAGFSYLGSGRAEPGAYSPVKTWNAPDKTFLGIKKGKVEVVESEAMLPHGMKLERVQSLRSRIFGVKAGDFVTIVEGKVIPIYRFAERGAKVPEVNVLDLIAIRYESLAFALKKVLGKKGFALNGKVDAALLRNKAVVKGQDIIYLKNIKPAEGGTYVLGDIHGQFGEFLRELQVNGLTKGTKWVAKDSKLVQVGDLFDRGHGGVKVVKLLADAKGKGADIKQVLGNHDVIFYQAAKILETIPKSVIGSLKTQRSKWILDRASKYLLSKGRNAEAEVLAKFRANKGHVYEAIEAARSPVVMKWLENADAVYVNKGTLYAHADSPLVYTELLKEAKSKGYKGANTEIVNKYVQDLMNTPEGALRYYNLTTELRYKIDRVMLDSFLKEFEAERLVHGHTPKGNVHSYFDGKAINVDAGAGTMGKLQIAKMEDYIKVVDRELKKELEPYIEKAENLYKRNPERFERLYRDELGRRLALGMRILRRPDPQIRIDERSVGRERLRDEARRVAAIVRTERTARQERTERTSRTGRAERTERTGRIDRGIRSAIRPEPRRPEPQRPEPIRPEPNRPEPERPEPNRPEPERPEPNRPGPRKPMPKPPTTTAKRIVPKYPSSDKQNRLPEGSITWRQGIFWKWIPLEDYVRGAAKPRTLPKGVVPEGARFTNLRTPSQTIQMIGDPGASVPDISVDLGIADIFISDQAQTIRYAGKGTKTDVGTNLPSTTKGMSIEGGGEAVEAKGHAYAQKSVARTSSKPSEVTRTKKQSDDFSDLTSLTEEDIEELSGVSEEDIWGEPRRKPVNRPKMSKKPPSRGNSAVRSVRL